jgi:hypothetical protein
MGWTPPFVCAKLARCVYGRGDQVFIKHKESDINATTVAVDLAKSIFQLAVADEHWRVVETQ